MGKKNVHKLSSESVQSYSLLGISSHENDYRLSWALNEHLGFHFGKTASHCFLHPKFNETLEFSHYMYTDEAISREYHLISNRCDNGFLLEEFRNIDFLLLIDEIDKTQFQSFMNQVKTIPFVSAVFSIDLVQLKNKNRLFKTKKTISRLPFLY